ncbi:MAG: zinc ribbon domain-containing protein [Candidatus Heimdallarchaeaceae archaeon]
MKECLACWEEIEDTEEVCHHCGSNQEEVKDYLALVLLKQGKRKIDVPKDTPVLDYVFDIDPTTKEQISVAIKSSASSQEPETATTIPQGSGIQPDGTYKPSRPGWLGRPQAAKDEETKESPDGKQDDLSSKDEETKESPDGKQDDLSSKGQKDGTKVKNISCPKCSEDVPLLQYCKFCGQKLLRNCPNCNKEITLTAKFCTGCGTKVDPLLEKKQSDE